ncbi:MAG TPA: alpha/beta fold hydrolase [Oculatellaceae cyanobacterium]
MIQVQKKIGVLLFHGLTGMPSELKPVAKILAQQGFQVETPLIAGHGGTHQDLLKTTWKDWLAGAQEAFEQLREHCTDVYVGGLSMGATLAAVLAARNPDVKGLILLSPHLGMSQDNLQFNQCLLPIGYYLKPLHGIFYWTEKAPFGLKDPRLQKKIEQALKASKKGHTENYGLYRTYIGSIYQMLDLAEVCKREASRIHCPALILQSMEDTITKPENATLIYFLLDSEIKMLRMFTGCNHVMSVDLRKKDVGQWMVNFIQVCSFPGCKTSVSETRSPLTDVDQLHMDLAFGPPDLSNPRLSRLFSSKRLDEARRFWQSEGQMMHHITIRQGEIPILCWPILENQTPDQQKSQIQWLKRFRPSGRTLRLGYPDHAIPTIGLDLAVSANILREAWKRAWLAVSALQTAHKNTRLVANIPQEWSKTNMPQALPATMLSQGQAQNQPRGVRNFLSLLGAWHWLQDRRDRSKNPKRSAGLF